MNRCLAGLATVAALSMTGHAIAQDAGHADIVAACLAGSNLPEPICTCMADKLTGDEFSDTQRTWYVLSQTDPDAAESIVGDMSPTETMKIGMFSTSGPGQCASGG